MPLKISAIETSFSKNGFNIANQKYIDLPKKLVTR